MTKLSAVLITSNEERNIARCLSSLANVVDEIIVMDAFSTDTTAEICRQYNVRFFQQQWKGYGIQKNDANAIATNDFILSIDADEELSEELRTSILKEKEKGLDGMYEMERRSSFCGMFIKYGSWNPDKKIRIFNGRQIHWNTRAVHEGLEIDNKNKVTKLQGYLLHYTSNSIEERVITSNKYSTLTAQLYYEKGKRSSLLKILIKPFVSFLSGFIFKRGFLDGYNGFILAILISYEDFLKYSKLFYLQKKAKS